MVTLAVPPFHPWTAPSSTGSAQVPLSSVRPPQLAAASEKTTAVTAIKSHRIIGGTSGQGVGHDRLARQLAPRARGLWNVLGLAAALTLACTCQRAAPPPAAPPPSPPPPPESAPGASGPDSLAPLRDQAPSFSIALLPLHPPKQDLKAVVAAIA